MPVFQPVVPPLPASLSFAGKSAVVTGPTYGGLGWAAALHLAQHHVSTLILAVRTHKTGEAAKEALLTDPVVRALPAQPTIRIYELDLARPSSVLSFASKVLGEVPTLNILLLNAGVGSLKWRTTPETNTEEMFQVNFLSNAILCVRLLPLLHSSAQKSGSTSYITIVGSRAQTLNTYTKHPIPETTTVFAFLNDRARYRFQRYADSKTLVSMWVRELAKRIDASVVTVNDVCPGMVTTNIDAKQPWWIKYPVVVIRAIRSRSAEVGGRTLVNAVSAGSDTHGKLLLDYTVWQNTFLGTDAGKKMGKRVWEETLAAAENLAPGSVQEAKLKD
ncbi:putative short-chain dehydrogenase/reductase family protein [Mycena epipterygia]|nr:putative short-chain dehydrogenase/reductase family protein [Mycena epipterygia]